VMDPLQALFEPTMTTGGCLWFPDLTLADPYHILPVAVSAMLLVNLLPRSAVARRALLGMRPKPSRPGTDEAVLAQPRVMRGIHRGLAILAASVWYITAHFPSGFHLYWLSSSIIHSLLVSGVSRSMPVPKSTVKPCKDVEFPFLQRPPP